MSRIGSGAPWCGSGHYQIAATALDFGAMKRFIVILALALLPAGCIDNDGRGYGPGYGNPGCWQYSSCATCTPVLGCGWCSMGNKGLCTDQPNACTGPGISHFSWTWEVAFCPGAVDGGAEADASPNADGPPATPDGGIAPDGGDAASGG
jgi:hypothetical protein